MKLKWIIFSVLAFSLLWVSPGMLKANASPHPQPALAQDHDWDQPPQDYHDVQRQGFHEGVEAARKDYDHHHHMDADHHDQYRHPPVRHDDRDAYREGFRRGYEQAWSHLSGDHDHDHDNH